MNTRRTSAAAKHSRRRDARRLRSVARVRSGKPIHTLAKDPAVSSATTSIPSSKPGHAPTLPLARCSATRRLELRGLVGRVVLPKRFPPDGFRQMTFTALVRRRSWGSTLRRFIPADGWHGISAAPGPRVVRAARPPRFIFVGVTDRPNELHRESELKGGRPGTSFSASTSGLRSHQRSVSTANAAQRRI